LIKSKRLPEAALFAKTYCPSKISEIVKLWKEDLQKSHPVAGITWISVLNFVAQKIADPLEYPEQFEDLVLATKIEEFIYPLKANAKVPAHQYAEYNDLLSQDLFQIVKENPDVDLSQLELIPKIQPTNPLLANMGARTSEDTEWIIL